MEYYGNNDWRDYHLAHFGVKGMKWGRHDKARTHWWENAGRTIGNGIGSVAGIFKRKKTPEIYKPHTVRDGREITKEETASRKKKVAKAFKRLIDGARKSIKRFGSDLRKEGRRTVKAFNKEIKSSKKTLNKDKNAMEKMGLAQYIAGMGFSNVGLGIVHSMAHQLGATYDVAHGIACSLFLPYVLEFNGKVCAPRFRIMAEKCFDIDMTDKTDEDAVRLVVEKVRELETKLGVPQHMSEVGANKEDFDVLAQKAIDDPCTGGNPREVTKEGIIELFNIAF
jgi:hypothetical protein